jgi:ATP synthase protein I
MMVDQNKNKDKESNLRKMLSMSSIGLVLPSAIAIGLFIGYTLDKWLNTHPWMLMVFLILGIISGFVSLFREINRFKNENGD